ncbi:hypothetical protein MYCTH_2295917 [Thermothelomyces thermophilus ATCC 42464]|uniref:Uncharacterized protein n=1 Tax=Thermothelomyces thermophilus (strain ATCC 42464 / BCRC 31852 / DSM 1799) TaxID=573729 RepID=G2Q6X8_THET4|nr:uncharacterized protein MYCTH_2295917 [Thermothelomyces thermophilus ATCC 42464]AEO53956.1 hypothetical protein MYCTH_2295917 [Thermothelomyces thermophilus ATCC 42464]
MAVTLPAFSNIAAPDVRSTVAPVLSTLPAAASSTEPATTVLPSLSPILRQRVQLLASASSEPWIRLLTYTPSKVAELTGIARSVNLEPHPVSGEIELDWDQEVGIRYKRIDEETLQTMVVLKELNLFFRLVYCTGDPDGGGDGWRVGEVGVADPSFLASFGGFSSIDEAEKSFRASKSTNNAPPSAANGSHAATRTNGGWSAQAGAYHDDGDDDDDDDDDDYWARYDATPSRTPAMKRSPAPGAGGGLALRPDINRSQCTEAEDAYFARYDSVQPAMDNHDPDEETNLGENAEHVEPLPPQGLGKAQPVKANKANGAVDSAKEASNGSNLAQPIPIKPDSVHSSGSGASREESWVMAHPRPGSASSTGSQTVAKLEEAAENRQQAEFGVRQHISRSIRSLFLLSRASGIDREEFERMVRTELDVLGIVEDDI